MMTNDILQNGDLPNHIFCELKLRGERILVRF